MPVEIDYSKISDWSEHQNADGIKFYFSKSAQISTWENPSTFQKSQKWSVHSMWDGREFYVNKETKVSVWSVPPEFLANAKTEETGSVKSWSSKCLDFEALLKDYNVDVTGTWKSVLNNKELTSDIRWYSLPSEDEKQQVFVDYQFNHHITEAIKSLNSDSIHQAFYPTRENFHFPPQFVFKYILGFATFSLSNPDKETIEIQRKLKKALTGDYKNFIFFSKKFVEKLKNSLSILPEQIVNFERTYLINGDCEEALIHREILTHFLSEEDISKKENSEIYNVSGKILVEKIMEQLFVDLAYYEVESVNFKRMFFAISQKFSTLYFDNLSEVLNGKTVDAIRSVEEELM